MRCADRFRAGVIAATVASSAMFGACRGMKAPPGAISRPADVPMRTAGMWVEVVHPTGVVIDGELLAVHPDTLFVIRDDTLTGVPRNEVAQVRLARYAQQRAPLVWWALGGIASTASHGFFLLVTAPLWTATGIGAAVAESRRAIWHTLDWSVLQPYARFPQGIPPTLDRRELRDAIR